MNELRRTVYLDALGVDSYVSRAQLPGAATTRRLVLNSANAPAPAAVLAPDTVFALAAEQKEAPARVQVPPVPAVEPPPASHPAAPSSGSIPRFSIIAMRARRWLWLELRSEMPLTSEQVWLVEAMAVALEHEVVRSENDGGDSLKVSLKPEITQFDWPIHNNHQLGLDSDSARAGVIGFIERKLHQHQCQGVVLMGQACEQWVSSAQLGVPSVTTLESASVLANPSLKRQVWRDLLQLVAPQ